MLNWPKGRRDSDGIWEKIWYKNVKSSTSFNKILSKEYEIPKKFIYANVVCHPRAFRAGSETGIRSTEVRAHRVRAAPAASATTPGHAAATQRNAPTARQTARTQRHALADETRPRGARGYYPAAAACGMRLAGGSRALPRSSVGSASGWRSSGNVQCTLRERVCLPWPLRFTGNDT